MTNKQSDAEHEAKVFITYYEITNPRALPRLQTIIEYAEKRGYETAKKQGVAFGHWKLKEGERDGYHAGLLHAAEIVEQFTKLFTNIKAIPAITGKELALALREEAKK